MNLGIPGTKYVTPLASRFWCWFPWSQGSVQHFVHTIENGVVAQRPARTGVRLDRLRLGAIRRVVEKIARVRHAVQQRLDARQKVVVAGEVRARAAPAVRATPAPIRDAAMQAVERGRNGDEVHVVRHQAVGPNRHIRSVSQKSPYGPLYANRIPPLAQAGRGGVAPERWRLI